MPDKARAALRDSAIWAILAAVILIPLIAALNSPLLAWREPVYIAAGIAGIVGMALLLVQPLLMAGLLPRISRRHARYLHRLVGSGLVLAVIAHVAALWITSPPDVVDALLLRSPTRFSVWGVIAMWAVFASALIAVTRHRFKLGLWRLMHTALFATIVIGTVLHALKIDGTMEQISKIALSVAILATTAGTIAKLRVWRTLRR